NAGNREGAKSCEVKIDSRAPETAAMVAPLANAAGWRRAEVVVALLASDPGSGVEEIRYALSGAESGQDAVSGSQARVTIATEGRTQLDFYAVDQVGNEEPPRTLEVKLDATAPTT